MLTPHFGQRVEHIVIKQVYGLLIRKDCL